MMVVSNTYIGGLSKSLAQNPRKTCGFTRLFWIYVHQHVCFPAGQDTCWPDLSVRGKSVLYGRLLHLGVLFLFPSRQLFVFLSPLGLGITKA